MEKALAFGEGQIWIEDMPSKYTRNFWADILGVDNSLMYLFDVPILFMDATYSNNYHVMIRLTRLVSSSGPQQSRKNAETWVAAIETHWLSEACRNRVQSPNSKFQT
jgi:hypothetical protein